MKTVNLTPERYNMLLTRYSAKDTLELKELLKITKQTKIACNLRIDIIEQVLTVRGKCKDE